MDLKNAHVVVTGASAGIGHSLALELARGGARLSLVARRREALESLVAEVEEEAVGEAVALPADLVDAPEGWLEAAHAAFGPVDVLVNNAGVQVIGPTHAVSVEEGERSLALNLTTPLRLIRRVLPAMRESGRGAIVNVASMAALAPTPAMTYYNASKAGLAGASEALRGELRGTGVNVVTVYPGIIPTTDMGRAGLESYETSAVLRMQPRGDVGVLARRVRRAIERGRARVIYPRMNVLARLFPGLTRWTMDRFTPRLASAPSA